MHLNKTDLLDKLAPLQHDRDYHGATEIDAQLRPAAVLVPLVYRDDEPHILLTKRTDHLHHHPGQVSFPGGGLEDDDLSFEAAALRETQEEIGIESGAIELLGRLPTYRTGTGFLVVPVVAVVQQNYVLVPDDFEVAEVFEAPASHVLVEANFQRKPHAYRGKHFRLFETYYQDYYIWGATAGMLVMFSRVISGRPVVGQPEFD